MQITNLWHTECLIECNLTNGKSFRLLLDSWLSNYSVADLMERSQKVEIDWKVFPKIDVLYLSHSHLDHIDPYFLTELYKEQNPILLLAETLAYLEPTFRKYLPESCIIKYLRHLETQTFENEIEITWLNFCTDSIGNEEDVLTLFISHGKKAAYFEIDTTPPLIYEEQELLVSLLTKKKYDAIAYIASSNELEWNLVIFDSPTKKSRDTFVRKHLQERKESIEETYDLIAEHELPLAILSKLRVHTAITGQWLQFPKEISPELSWTKFLSLEEIAEIHTRAAKLSWLPRSFSALNWGQTLFVGKKEVESSESLRTRIPGIKIYSRLQSNLDISHILTRKWVPLSRDISIDSILVSEQESRILDALNSRFLPTKFADPNDNLKQIILSLPDRSYRISIRYGSTVPYLEKIYIWNFSKCGFEEENNLNEGGPSDNLRSSNSWKQNLAKKVQEAYFANDIIDFLDGKQELYCNFFHKLDTNLSYRFWTVLWNNFINHDLVIRKVSHHFERAIEGKTAESFVKNLIKDTYSIEFDT